MSNLSHKVAIASVCTALGFVIGTNTEAKAVTLSLEPTTIFTVQDVEEPNATNGPYSFDGRGDYVRPGDFDFLFRGSTGEYAPFAEFNISSFSVAPGTVISNAVFQARIASLTIFSGYGVNGTLPSSIGIFGYVGNGTADPSDFEAGVLLSSVDVSSSSRGDILNFNVTPFVNQLVSNGDTFAGFGLRASNIGGIALDDQFRLPSLVVEAEPVPEPTTIFGSAIALSLGGWLKRKKLSPRNKTAPQG